MWLKDKTTAMLWSSRKHRSLQLPLARTPELDALGDELLAEDEDSSYLDAVQAPDSPSGLPGAEREKNKVCGAGNYVMYIVYMYR